MRRLLDWLLEDPVALLLMLGAPIITAWLAIMWFAS